MCKTCPAQSEPSLAELIDDPLVHAVMARDRVSLAELVAVMLEAQRRLALPEPA